MPTPIEFFVLTRVNIHAVKGHQKCLSSGHEMTMKLAVKQRVELSSSKDFMSLLFGGELVRQAREQFVEVLRKDRDLQRSIGKTEWMPVFPDIMPKIFVSQQALDDYINKNHREPGIECNPQIMREALLEIYEDANQALAK